MKKNLLSAVASLVCFTTLSTAQVTLFTENFNTGTAGGFTLNTSDVSCNPAGYNFYVVNNAYTGGNGFVNCFGMQPYTIVSTATQPAGITGNPTSHYLHTMSTAGQTDGIFCSSFAAADGLCFATEHTFAKMTNGVNTTGYTGVSLSFWWTCGGGTGKHGEVYYSTNGGSVWTLITTPITQYNNQSTWIQQTITLPAFDNVADLRFGFRFFNTANFNPVVDPGFSIDDVLITGSGCAQTGSSSSPTICQGQTYFAQGANQFDSGTYYDTLVNSCGEDSVVTTNLTVTPVNISVTAGLNILTANATSATFQWYNCTTMQNVAGATGSSFSSTATGNFAVIVTQNGCTDTSVCNIIQGTGIDSHTNAYSFTVSPNPFNDQATIKISGLKQNISAIDVNVSDAIGRKVYPGIRKDKNEIIISRNSLPGGMYFIQLTADKQVIGVVKVMVE